MSPTPKVPRGSRLQAPSAQPRHAQRGSNLLPPTPTVDGFPEPEGFMDYVKEKASKADVSTSLFTRAQIDDGIAMLRKPRSEWSGMWTRNTHYPDRLPRGRLILRLRSSKADRIVVPIEETYQFLKYCHGNHLGRSKTIDAIHATGHHINQAAVTRFVQLCPGCYSRNGPSRARMVSAAANAQANQSFATPGPSTVFPGQGAYLPPPSSSTSLFSAMPSQNPSQNLYPTPCLPHASYRFHPDITGQRAFQTPAHNTSSAIASSSREPMQHHLLASTNMTPSTPTHYGFYPSADYFVSPPNNRGTLLRSGSCVEVGLEGYDVGVDTGLDWGGSGSQEGALGAVGDLRVMNGPASPLPQCHSLQGAAPMDEYAASWMSAACILDPSTGQKIPDRSLPLVTIRSVAGASGNIYPPVASNSAPFRTPTTTSSRRDGVAPTSQSSPSNAISGSVTMCLESGISPYLAETPALLYAPSQQCCSDVVQDVGRHGGGFCPGVGEGGTSGVEGYFHTPSPVGTGSPVSPTGIPTPSSAPEGFRAGNSALERGFGVASRSGPFEDVFMGAPGSSATGAVLPSLHPLASMEQGTGTAVVDGQGELGLWSDYDPAEWEQGQGNVYFRRDASGSGTNWGRRLEPVCG